MIKNHRGPEAGRSREAKEEQGGEAGGGAIREQEQEGEEGVLLTTGPLGQSAMGMIAV